jgi:site-specific DNA-cytosine methylase
MTTEAVPGRSAHVFSTIHPALPFHGTRRPPLTVIDLFAGAGGLSLGFEKLRLDGGAPAFRRIAAVDSDAEACAALRANWPDHLRPDGTSRVYEGDLASEATRDALFDLVGDRPADIVLGRTRC